MHHRKGSVAINWDFDRMEEFQWLVYPNRINKHPREELIPFTGRQVAYKCACDVV